MRTKNIHRRLLQGIFSLCWLADLCGCGRGQPGPPDIPAQTPDVVSLAPHDWHIYYSSGMPPSPASSKGGAWSFKFPSAQGNGHVNYVQTPFNATVPLHEVSITFRIESNSAQYVERDAQDVPPATFRLFFEQRGDDLYDPNGRWWANASMYNLGSLDGETLTETVPLTPDQWTNVIGEEDPRAFADALRNIGWVGVTFGGQYFAGHGVALNDGTASYVLIDYTVK